MTDPIAKKPADFFRTYPLWIAALLLFTFLLRLIEHLGAVLQGTGGTATALLYGLLNDAGFALSLAFVLCLPLLLAWYWKPRVSFVLFLVFGSGYLLISAALSRYYLVTNTLLGADLFGYSLADIQTTVRSSTQFSFTDLLPLALLVLFVVAVRWVQKRSLQVFPWAAGILLLAGIGCTFRYNAFSAQPGTPGANLSVNKCAYFVDANLSDGNTGAAKITFAPYPLLRNDNSTDALTPFFDLKGQKPNFVFLIVEGLGRDFTGPSAAYGGFMPFLDSLSGQGLYWSNFLSSAGRSFAGPGTRKGRPGSDSPVGDPRPRAAAVLAARDPEAVIALQEAERARTLFFSHHPATRRAVDAAHAALVELQSSDPAVQFTFLSGEVLAGDEVLPELEGWEWSDALAQAGIERIEFLDRVDDDQFIRLLGDLAARLGIRPASSADARQGGFSPVRFGLVTVDSGARASDENLAMAGLSYALRDERDAVTWMHDEVRGSGRLHAAEADGVVRSLSLAMHTEQAMVMPLLQLKEHDQYTTTHSMNVSVLAMALGEYLELGAETVRSLGLAGLLHDLGKVCIPQDILNKPGRLTEAERQVVHAHPAAAEGSKTFETTVHSGEGRLTATGLVTGMPG